MPKNQQGFPVYPIKPDVTPKFGEDGDPAFTLRARETGGGFEDAVCMPLFAISSDADPSVNEECTSTLQASDNKISIIDPNDWIIRGLTPREAERLQGFPDDWTKVPYRGKPADKCPDTPRYKAIGNSMAVPVIQWLGERISMVDDLSLELMFEGVR